MNAGAKELGDTLRSLLDEVDGLQAPTAAPRTTPMEHRWGERVELGIPVELRITGETSAGRMLDASISGALLQTPLALAVHAPLEVTFAAGWSRERRITLHATVVRTEPGRVGVEWRDMASPPLVEVLRAADREPPLQTRDRAFR